MGGVRRGRKGRGEEKMERKGSIGEVVGGVKTRALGGTRRAAMGEKE